MLLNISTWWQGLATFDKIFWVIALLFSLLFLIQTIISFIAGDSDVAEGDAEQYVTNDEGIGYQFFTIRNMITFFTMFGWAGVVCINSGLSKGLTIALATATGIAMVIMMLFILRSASRLRHSGTLVLENAIDKMGQTYLRIPSGRNGLGKVHITVQGTLHELEAMTDDSSDIATGRMVKVISIVNNRILLVTAQ